MLSELVLALQLPNPPTNPPDQGSHLLKNGFEQFRRDVARAHVALELVGDGRRRRRAPSRPQERDQAIGEPLARGDFRMLDV